MRAGPRLGAKQRVRRGVPRLRHRGRRPWPGDHQGRQPEGTATQQHVLLQSTEMHGLYRDVWQLMEVKRF